MAKAKKDENSTESVDSILGKIKSMVTGKEKIVIEEDAKPVAAAEEEPMELTEMVDSEESAGDDAAVSDEIKVLQEMAESLKVDLQQAAVEEPKTVEPEAVVDILQEIDESIGVEAEPAETQPQAMVNEPINANVAQEPVQNEPVMAPEVKKEFAEEISQNIISSQVATDMAEEKKENILSQEIAAKSGKAIQSLLNSIPRPDIDSPAFRSATTLEDIVLETMKPLLKEWLDKNLEVIVRDIVEREIKKIIPRD